jgi:hypothetical protein
MTKNHLSEPGLEPEATLVPHGGENGLASDQLEALIDKANLDTFKIGSKQSIEFKALSRVGVDFFRSAQQEALPFDSKADDQEIDQDVSIESPESPDLLEPMSELVADDDHSALFRYLFEPIDETSPEPKITLSDELQSNLRDLKDRLQRRYNVIIRNLENSENSQ